MSGLVIGRGEGCLRLAGNLGKRQLLFTGFAKLIEYQGPLYGKSLPEKTPQRKAKLRHLVASFGHLEPPIPEAILNSKLLAIQPKIPPLLNP